MRDAFQRHVAGVLDSPFVVLFESSGAYEAGDGLHVAKDAVDPECGRAVRVGRKIGPQRLIPDVLPIALCPGQEDPLVAREPVQDRARPSAKREVASVQGDVETTQVANILAE